MTTLLFNLYLELYFILIQMQLKCNSYIFGVWNCCWNSYKSQRRNMAILWKTPKRRLNRLHPTDHNFQRCATAFMLYDMHLSGIPKNICKIFLVILQTLVKCFTFQEFSFLLQEEKERIGSLIFLPHLWETVAQAEL